MSSMIKQFMIIITACVGVVSIASADSPPPDPAFHITYGVSDWRKLVPEKAAEYKTYRVIILSNPSYSDDEKAAKIAKKYTEIRGALSRARSDVYSAVSELKGVGNSVTKGSSDGDSKTSNAKCIGASKEHMYTTAKWARGAYKSGKDPADAGVISKGKAVDSERLVVNKGASVCAIKLKQSGKGRKVAYSEATFRIRPKHIEFMVEAEVLSMMYAISSTPI